MSNAIALYVEDEEDDALFMQMAFKRVGAEGTLRVVKDGRSALAYLKGEDGYADRAAHPLPALILLDLNLPHLSGFEVLSWIRAQTSFRETPVVIFSSSGRPEDRSKAESQGANHYALKPMSMFQFVDLAAELRKRWLQKAAGEPEAGMAASA